MTRGMRKAVTHLRVVLSDSGSLSVQLTLKRGVVGQWGPRVQGLLSYLCMFMCSFSLLLERGFPGAATGSIFLDHLPSLGHLGLSWV